MSVSHEFTPPNKENDEFTNEQLARILQRAHEQFGISLDVAAIVDRTITENGFTPVDPPLTPSVLEWIAQRMVDQDYAGYNHGSFARDGLGNVGFVKVNYGPENIVLTNNEDGDVVETRVGGPQREAEVLEALKAEGYETPSVLGYAPAMPEGASSSDAETFEMLVIEAILPEYGGIRERDSWSPSLSRLAAKKIATFAKASQEITLFKDEPILLPVEDLVDKLPQTGDAYEQKLLEVLEAYTHLNSPIVVHGDAWFNNIVARHDDSDLIFIDWELAGPGYQGQDAGRKLWDLTLTNDWRFDNYSENAKAFADEWSKTDDDRKSLAFGTVYESLRWISDRVRDIKDPATDEATRISLTQDIEDIKAHALLILDNLDSDYDERATS